MHVELVKCIWEEKLEKIQKKLTKVLKSGAGLAEMRCFAIHI